MSLLDTLTRAADEEQLRLKPLPEHAVAQQPEHLRRHYALLLAAVLTSQSEVSDAQTRLLRLLLDSLKLGDIRGPLFDQARELESEPLLEAARLIREARFAHHLVVDVLVLLRLDAPLGEDTVRLAGELAAFLGLDETALAQRARDAVDILGLSSEVYETDSSLSDKEGVDAEDTAHGSPLIAELWPRLLPRPLTADALRAGLQGGLWLLDANLNVDFPWQANDAMLVFRNGATLNTFAKEGEVKLSDCRLTDAVLDFQGACKITAERCDWTGSYDPAECRSALKSNGQAVVVRDCQFSTRNARAILVENNALTLTGSRFTHCGHAELNGGAVFHTDHARVIKGCCFDGCLAALGGAIYVPTIIDIGRCEFIACQSRALEDKNAGDVAIYGKQVKNRAISSCVFRQTSLILGRCLNSGDSSVVYLMSCQFERGNVYFHDKSIWSLSKDCSFLGGGEVEKKI